MILVIDTSTGETFLGLWEGQWFNKVKWPSGRNLSAEILIKLEKLYKDTNKEIRDTKAIIVNSGPGSFTGLRIGLSVGNTVAYSLNIPIVGVTNAGKVERLIEHGIRKIANQKIFNKSVIPEYGSEPNITKSKKK